MRPAEQDGDDGIAAARALALVDEVVWEAAAGPGRRLRLTYVSPALRRLTGHAPEDLTAGRVRWQDLIDPEDRRRVRTQQLAALRGEPGSLEHRVRTCEGQTRFVRSSFSPSLEGGRVVRLAGVVADVTTTQRREQGLARSRVLRSLATLAGGVAHGVNNQLVAVLAHVERLRQELDGHPAAWRLEKVEASARDVAHRADQLLAYARGGKHRVTRVDLGGLVRGAADLLQGRAGVEVALELDPALSSIEGDPRQLLHVLMALLHNAAEAEPHRGPVRVRTGAVLLDAAYCRALPGLVPGRYAQLTVEDHGAGMDAATLARCFEPFFSTRGRGRGLGLAACYGIVTNHGGHLTLDSAPGAGAVARVYLPFAGPGVVDETDEHDLRQLVALADNTPHEPLATPAVRLGKTVLVVDDEPTIVDVLDEHLRAAGYRVLKAPDGHAAVDLAGREPGPIDLIFLDLNMPHMDGPEAFPHLRRARPGAKVVLASGYDLDARAQRLLDQGAHRFVQKPFRVDVLVGLVDELLLEE
ncbi:MAG: response regulator [Planctomycetes bacterium]|nr:response regulator [Planctomycetota bacterium]